MRFPKRREVAERLREEIALVRFLAPKLPLAIPDFAWVADAAPGFPYAYAAYRSLPGDVGLWRADIDAAAAGATLGRFLARLHAIPLDDVTFAPRAPLHQHNLANWKTAVARAFQPIAQLCDPALRARAERYFATPGPASSSDSVLVHGDFTAENVLVDADGMPNAVIDWSDANRGDAAADLGGIYHWLGEAGLSSALASYGNTDAQLAVRTRCFGRCAAVMQTIVGVRTRDRRHIDGGLATLARLVPDVAEPYT